MIMVMIIFPKLIAHEPQRPGMIGCSTSDHNYGTLVNNFSRDFDRFITCMSPLSSSRLKYCRPNIGWGIRSYVLVRPSFVCT